MRHYTGYSVSQMSFNRRNRAGTWRKISADTLAIAESFVTGQPETLNSNNEVLPDSVPSPMDLTYKIEYIDPR